MSILIVAATAMEAAHVPAGPEVLITGIGKTAAAAAVAARLARGDVTAVINIGTAGALHAHHDGVFTPGVVLNHDISAAAIRSLGFDPHERLETGTGDAGVVLASGDVFVSDPVVRDRLARRADLVDMEGYAVAWAGWQADVPVHLVKAVSDRADEQAVGWSAAVDDSARRLGRWLADRLG